MDLLPEPIHHTALGRRWRNKFVLIKKETIFLLKVIAPLDSADSQVTLS